MTRVDCLTPSPTNCRLFCVRAPGLFAVTALMFSCLVDEAARLGAFQPAISGVLDLLMLLYR